jgi:hypothetical protein
MSREYKMHSTLPNFEQSDEWDVYFHTKNGEELKGCETADELIDSIERYKISVGGSVFEDPLWTCNRNIPDCFVLEDPPWPCSCNIPDCFVLEDPPCPCNCNITECSVLSTNGHRGPVREFDQGQIDRGVHSLVTQCGQPVPSSSDGIYFEPNPMPDYIFGETAAVLQTHSYQAESLFDFELSLSSSLIEKPMKIQQKPMAPSSRRININEWFIIDEPHGKKRRPLLYEFLRQLLDDENCSHIAQYVDKRRGVFKIHKRNEVAELWKYVKGRNSDSSKLFVCFLLT